VTRCRDGLALNAGIKAVRAKRRSGSAEVTRAQIAKLAVRPVRFSPPRSAHRGVSITAEHATGIPVYTLVPDGTAPAHRILYLHGGSYTYEITPVHWSLIRSLALAVPAQIVVPIYRKAPHSTADVTVPAMTDLLATLLDDGTDVSVMGDSAGGGMALAVAQRLRDIDGRQPAHIVLISPWLDVSLTDPRVAEIEPHDLMLGIAGLAESGRMYAGDLPLDDPRVSPIHGSLTGLAPLHVFTGTHDLLNADAHALRSRATAAGIDIDFHEEAAMQHDYPLLPLIKQGAAARRALAEVVRGKG
jgi:acetyl esterase/lipase